MDTGRPPEVSEVPDASASGPSAVDAGPGAPLDVGTILGEAWSTYASAWPACMVVYWGAAGAAWLLLIGLTATLASFNALAGEPEIRPFLQFVQFLGNLLIPAWIWIGQSLSFLKIARRQPVALADLFRGGPWLLTTLLAGGTLLAVAGIPCLLIYGAAEAFVTLHGGDALASMIRPLLPARGSEGFASFLSEMLALITITTAFLGFSYAALYAVTVRLGQFPYVIIDRSAGVLESHRMSWQLTRGRVATVFLVYLAQVTINLAGLLAFYVGLFFTLPMTSLLSAVTYHTLCGESCGDPRSGPASSEQGDKT